VKSKAYFSKEYTQIKPFI